MRFGLLRGWDHNQLGSISTLAEGRAAVALSRGGAPKNYPYTDPNEDACAFAFAGESALVAVADGHWGAGGSSTALERILEHHAPRWLAHPDPTERWCDEGPEVLADLSRALLAEAGESLIGRTTLSLCFRPAPNTLLVLAAGDSHVFACSGGGVRELCPQPAGARIRFVGDPDFEPERWQQAARTDVVTGPSDAVLLATDGLSERGIGVENPAAAAAQAASAAHASDPELRPLEAARALASEALQAQRRNRAGDNVATACLWWGS